MLRRPVEFTQFLSIRYTKRLAEAGIDGSVGSRGDSHDNALAESFNGLYKTELVYHEGPWKNADAVEWPTLTYIHWFNNRRLHGAIGMQPPGEYETTYYNRTRPAETAGPNKNSLYETRGLFMPRVWNHVPAQKRAGFAKAMYPDGIHYTHGVFGATTTLWQIRVLGISEPTEEKMVPLMRQLSNPCRRLEAPLRPVMDRGPSPLEWTKSDNSQIPQCH